LAANPRCRCFAFSMSCSSILTGIIIHLHGRRVARVSSVCNEYLERGQANDSRLCVDDGDFPGLFSRRPGCSASAPARQKGSGPCCAVLQIRQGRDQAKDSVLRCGPRPASTSLDPGSVCRELQTGFGPPSSRSGRCSHWPCVCPRFREPRTASEMILMRRARRSDSSGLRRATAL